MAQNPGEVMGLFAYEHVHSFMGMGAHTIGNKMEADYRRGDLFEKRRQMMSDWAAFCAAPSFKAGEVISLLNVA